MLFFKTPPVSGGGSGRGRTGAGSLGGDCGDCLGVGLTPPTGLCSVGGLCHGSIRVRSHSRINKATSGRDSTATQRPTLSRGPPSANRLTASTVILAPISLAFTATHAARAFAG